MPNLYTAYYDNTYAYPIVQPPLIYELEEDVTGRFYIIASKRLSINDYDDSGLGYTEDKSTFLSQSTGDFASGIVGSRAGLFLPPPEWCNTPTAGSPGESNGYFTDYAFALLTIPAPILPTITETSHGSLAYMQALLDAYRIAFSLDGESLAVTDPIIEDNPWSVALVAEMQEMVITFCGDYLDPGTITNANAGLTKDECGGAFSGDRRLTIFDIAVFEFGEMDPFEYFCKHVAGLNNGAGGWGFRYSNTTAVGLPVVAYPSSERKAQIDDFVRTEVIEDLATAIGFLTGVIGALPLQWSSKGESNYAEGDSQDGDPDAEYESFGDAQDAAESFEIVSDATGASPEAQTAGTFTPAPPSGNTTSASTSSVPSSTSTSSGP